MSEQTNEFQQAAGSYQKEGFQHTEEFYRLNEYQKTAVLDESPACVVNANVGSGKTTVLIGKILYLHLDRNVPLEKMTVLTFTNKAADEIVERLRQIKPDIAPDQVQGFGTFHSVALRMLKNSLPVEEAGWTKEFTVMDPDEETDLAMKIIQEHGLKVKYKNRLKKRLEQEYQNWLAGKAESRYRDDLYRLYPLLAEEKKRQNKMSFADLLRVSTELLRLKNAEPGGEHSEEDSDRSSGPAWILVDEVQDSDAMQIEFLEAMRESGKGEPAKIFAVGDPNQVIYSWRGTGDNMFYLIKHRFGAKELTLPVNYRSNASILAAANRFLQFGNRIQGIREEEQRITVRNHYDPFQEAEYLAEKIQTLHRNGKSYREIAVFYRLQSQSGILEKVFDRYGIPYELSVKKTLKDIPVLDWLVKVLRVSVNPADTQMAAEVLADPGYGEESMYLRMTEFSVETGKRESVSAGELFAYFGLREALHPSSAGYQEDERLVMDFLEKMCASCNKEMESGQGNFTAAVREFINSSALYGMKTDAGEKAPGDISECEGAGPEPDEKDREASPDKVNLMTLHASKGLEFDTVFIIGVNQGMIPLRCKDFEQEEEERRLFFVGITRAENNLELSWYTNPGEPGAVGEPSRYLRMIPEQLLNREGSGKTESERSGESEGGDGRKSDLHQLRKQVQEQIRLKRESVQKKEKEPKVIRVRHRKYGEGILISENDMMIEAEFRGYGRKKFLKAFGEVEVLGAV
ncbi:ATP-dependent helicase [Mediterraneibacter glycyrrhizinilyticus]|uniref:ATP-dependent helicase n=1 Tax=Mediterraneibacter glycyrrhizinilyticus TaxID=342942 RepID=UPI0025A36131|nr:ATP-dependent helicase [Mediterraneibacter glycyrrhizinilyticus]MDM8211657.1 ATP-dependent helicase [Mediterraneibacter glycyrrhizinilyticus]